MEDRKIVVIWEFILHFPNGLFDITKEQNQCDIDSL